MGFLASNIKYLRKQEKGLTQEELANKIGIKRALIGSYEEDRVTPKLETIQNLAIFFKVTIDELLNSDLSISGKIPKSTVDIEGRGLRVLTNITDKDNKELITVVPAIAKAGYLNGYSDSQFIEQLPAFDLPLPELASDRTYRAFQIEGESMLPIPPKSYIISEYIANWKEIKDGRCYIVITKDEGIVYKRLYNYISEKSELLLKSDNPETEPYSIKVEGVLEVWRACGYISFELPDIEANNISLIKLSSLVADLSKELKQIKENKS